MILGLGSDICDIRRVEAVIARHGDRFLERVFTPLERAKAGRRTEKIQAATYAKRFAAKEAAAKALGTGFRKGVFFADLGVVNLPSGQPTMLMTGGAAVRLAAITPPGSRAMIALTMTDEYPYAYAQVIISAVPLESVPHEVAW
jgi:holo-[acyl-carrier protein] synthase